MTVSTDAILAYGYDLAGNEADWNVEEVDEYGSLSVDWFDPEGEDGDLVGNAVKRLLTAVGFTETDWRTAGYFQREREAKARLGVEFESYCSGDYPMYVLATKVITVSRGDVSVLDLAALAREPVEQDWDTKLAAAMATLGLTPKQKPGWLLCSYWG